MAQGDMTIFNEAKAYMIDGGWEPTDDIKCAILDNTLAPTAADITPALGDYTQVGTTGTYISGGTSLGNLGTCVSQTAGTMKFDSATNPSWAQNASNDVDAYWGLIYNDTDINKLAIAFVDLGGPANMSAGDLTITWHVNGIFTIA